MEIRSFPDPENDHRAGEETVAPCPVCSGHMELVYERHQQRVMVCVDCRSGLTIPATAWAVARDKTETK
jgi:ssDNA-binding Zn-finger/Zn-ribbon topoisomerase 1